MNLYHRILKMNLNDYNANFEVMKDYIKVILDNNYLNNDNFTQNEEILDLVIFSIINIKIKNNKIYSDFLSLIEGKKENSNYNQESKKMKSEINYTDIQKFLKSILRRKTIKELITFLFGDNYCSNFTEEYIDAFVDNYLKFVPFKGGDYSGITDRFTLKSYIFLDQDIYDILEINQNDKDKITKALKIGRAIIIIFRELSHNFYSYILEFYNYANLTFESPRKKIIDLNEDGFFIDLILFGRIINNVNLEEMLFILNENNYNKDLKNFQKDFVILQDNKEFEGIFSDFNKIKTMNTFNDYKNISIMVNPSQDEISSRNSLIRIKQGGNCIMGAPREIDVDLINDYFNK